MRRRDFIKILAASAASLPLTARAQQAAMPLIGFLNSGSPDRFAPMVSAFLEGLKEAGYVEGRNVAIEYRWANGHYDRLPALVGELVRSPSLGHCRDQHACQSRSKVLDHFDSDCFHHWRRPSPARTCREFEPTRRQCHGRDANDRRSCAETGGAGSRIGPAGDHFWHAHQSEKSIGRVRETRTHSRRPSNSESNSTFCTSAPTQNLKRPSRPSANRVPARS